MHRDAAACHANFELAFNFTIENGTNYKNAGYIPTNAKFYSNYVPGHPMDQFDI